jgi:RHS repeat-associated protein
VSSSGTLASANTHRFSSKEWIPTAGFYYYLYRFYDPNLQRWVNRDPIEEEGGLNLYEFAEHNPVSFLDPDGGKPILFPILLPKPPVMPPPVLVPIAVAAAVGAAAAVAIDVCTKQHYDQKKKECDEEWDSAFKQCKEWLSQPNPPLGVTGGYKNVMDCARGLVSEDCGGNKKDHGKKKPRKSYRF